MFLMSTKKVTGRDYGWVTSHRFLIKSSWFIIAATKEVSEKMCYSENCTKMYKKKWQPLFNEFVGDHEPKQ